MAQKNVRAVRDEQVNDLDINIAHYNIDKLICKSTQCSWYPADVEILVRLFAISLHLASSVITVSWHISHSWSPHVLKMPNFIAIYCYKCVNLFAVNKSLQCVSTMNLQGYVIFVAVKEAYILDARQHVVFGQLWVNESQFLEGTSFHLNTHKTATRINCS